MDRLSAYAARESESDSTEQRRKTEEEATTQLLEKLRISKEAKPPTSKADQPDDQQVESAQTNGETPEAPSVEESDSKTDGDDSTAQNDEKKPLSVKSRGIPETVKLYEIFYEQVINLVNAQRLPIQDTTALLVSLAGLAL